MMRGRRAQLDTPILSFVVIVIGLLLLSPVVLKVMIGIRDPVAAALANQTGGAVAAANFSMPMNAFINFWDQVVTFAFIVAIIVLFVSSFLIDTHPFWIFLYIFVCFMMILFAPHILASVDAVYNSPTFATEVSQLTFMDNIRTNFTVFLVGIMVITGIIIYGKIAFFPNQSGGSGGGGSSQR